MMNILVGLINAITVVFIIDRFTCGTVQETRKYKMLLFCFFCMFFVGTLKMYLIKQIKGFTPFLALLCLIYILYIVGRISANNCILIVGACFLWGLMGDASSFLVFYFIPSPPNFGSLDIVSGDGYLIGVIISDFVQIILSNVYSIVRLKRRNPRVKEGWRISAFALLIEFWIILGGLIVRMNELIDADWVYLNLAAINVVVLIGITSLILIKIHEDDGRRLKNKLAKQKENNQLLFEHYKELEVSYRKLHQFRHDFHNMLDTAYRAAQNGDFVIADNLLDSMEERLERDEDDGKENLVG